MGKRCIIWNKNKKNKEIICDVHLPATEHRRQGIQVNGKLSWKYTCNSEYIKSTYFKCRIHLAWKLYYTGRCRVRGHRFSLGGFSGGKPNFKFSVDCSCLCNSCFMFFSLHTTQFLSGFLFVLFFKRASRRDHELAGVCWSSDTTCEQLAGEQPHLAPSGNRGACGVDQAGRDLSQGLISSPALSLCAGPSKAHRGKWSWWKAEDGVLKSYTQCYDGIAILNEGKWGFFTIAYV